MSRQWDETDTSTIVVVLEFADEQTVTILHAVICRPFDPGRTRTRILQDRIRAAVRDFAATPAGADVRAVRGFNIGDVLDRLDSLRPHLRAHGVLQLRAETIDSTDPQHDWTVDTVLHDAEGDRR